MQKNVVKIFNSPWIAGTVTAVIAGLILYNLLNREMDPLYSISDSKLIATNEVNSDIQIWYRGEQVDKLFTVNMLLWNDGDALIEHASIPDDFPISLKSIDPILDVKLIKKSRSSLRLEALNTYQDEEDDYYVSNIKILGNDALEPMDYMLFSILYTGSNIPKMHLSSRVKGTKDGFQEVEWGKLNPNKPTAFQELRFVILSFFGILFMVWFYLNPPDPKDRTDRIMRAILIGSMFVSFVFYLIRYLIALNHYSEMGRLII